MTFRKKTTVNRPGVEVVVSYDSTVREWRCRIVAANVHDHDADYFTSDRADALATANQMADRTYKNLVFSKAIAIPLDELNELQNIVLQVRQQIGYDAIQACEEADDPLTNDAAIELCLDADRPQMVSETAWLRTKLAYQKHGFDAVCLAVGENLKLV